MPKFLVSTKEHVQKDFIIEAESMDHANQKILQNYGNFKPVSERSTSFGIYSTKTFKNSEYLIEEE